MMCTFLRVSLVTVCAVSAVGCVVLLSASHIYSSVYSDGYSDAVRRVSSYLVSRSDVCAGSVTSLVSGAVADVCGSSPDPVSCINRSGSAERRPKSTSRPSDR